jgi:alpha-D-ribose 1-methylphosphonate 5-triphosphate synthase subunit PhnG
MDDAPLRAERQAIMAVLTYKQNDELDYCIRQLQHILEAGEHHAAEFGTVPLIAGGLCTNKIDIREKTADLKALIAQLKDVRASGLEPPLEYFAERGLLQTVARICQP